MSLPYTVATVLAALTLPWTGKALDRYGPRRGVVVIALLFGVACVGMGVVGGLATLFAGFFLLRALGQGALGLVSLHAVNLWFVHRRGLAVGLMGRGLALATAFVLPLLAVAIDALGWRTTYVLMGAVLLAVLLPLGGLLLRGHPERFGLRPDGLAADAEEAPLEQTYTLHEARRTGIFWLLTAKGFMKTIFIGGTAIGPPLLALGEAVPGGYAAVLWGLTAIPLALLAFRRGLDLG